MLHAELQSRLDKDGDRASHLEVALSRKQDQMDEALRVREAHSAESGVLFVLEPQVEVSLDLQTRPCRACVGPSCAVKE